MTKSIVFIIGHFGYIHCTNVSGSFLLILFYILVKEENGE